MPISPEMKTWLDEAGFKNQCFISYPHTGESQMTEFAQRIGKDIHNELVFRMAQPSVFFDRTHIPPGADWNEHLRENLCGSVTMVAILAPIYLDEAHEWCGREWAAMAQLGNHRLPKKAIQPIIPVLFRKTDMPPEAGARQPIDLSRVSLQGRRYYNTREFRKAITDIVDHIIEIAGMIHENKVQAETENFVFPRQSAFRKCSHQPPPFRES
jgi:hypothetical protein